MTSVLDDHDYCAGCRREFKGYDEGEKDASWEIVQATVKAAIEHGLTAQLAHAIVTAVTGEHEETTAPAEPGPEKDRQPAGMAEGDAALLAEIGGAMCESADRATTPWVIDELSAWGRKLVAYGERRQAT